MRRRLLRTLVMATLLGAATNVLVTAWCVWRVSANYAYDGNLCPCVRDGMTFYVNTSVTRGKTIFRWFGAANVMWPPGIQDPKMEPPGWAELGTRDLAASAKGDGFVTRTFVAYGWPMLAFRGGETTPQVYAAGQPSDLHDFGCEVLPPMVNASAGWQETRTTPFLPVLPGVVVNTGAYASVWWVVVALAGALRRRQRRRGNRCLECGYNQAGIGAHLACPECGAAEFVVQYPATAPTPSTSDTSNISRLRGRL